jgi:hypothetical protein
LQRECPVFVLDENFPERLLLEIIQTYTPELDLRPIRSINARLTGGLPDHRLILALHQLGVEGLVTNDDSMLALPEVLAIVEQTGFTVVACRRTGHDPLVATGLLLTHLARIARRHVRSTAQVWRLSAPDRGPETFRDLADSAEERSGRRIRDYRLPEAELGRPVL